MKTIENKNDLLAWATEINQGISLHRKCDMQDIYAHSKECDIDAAFIAADGDRKLIICSVNNVMAFSEVERLLSVLARHKAEQQMQQEYAELDERISEIQNREQHINELETSLETARREIQRLSDDLQQARTARDSYKRNAEKFEQLKQILGVRNERNN